MTKKILALLLLALMITGFLLNIKYSKEDQKCLDEKGKLTLFKIIEIDHNRKGLDRLIIKFVENDSIVKAEYYVGAASRYKEDNFYKGEYAKCSGEYVFAVKDDDLLLKSKEILNFMGENKISINLLEDM